MGVELETGVVEITEVVVDAGLVVVPPPPADVVAPLPPPGTTVGTVDGCRAVFQVAVVG